MVTYRRTRLPGATYFLTATLADRNTGWLVERIDDLRIAFAAVRREHPFEVIGMVVLPDHFHTIWKLPAGDSDYSTRMRLLKGRFSRALARSGVAHERRDNGEPAVWARRFWEHTIRDELDLQRHVDYVHFSPVKHGLVTRVGDWPYSTFHRFVREGRLAHDWGGRDARSARSGG
jgi:putative transposase